MKSDYIKLVEWQNSRVFTIDTATFELNEKCLFPPDTINRLISNAKLVSGKAPKNTSAYLHIYADSTAILTNDGSTEDPQVLYIFKGKRLDLLLFAKESGYFIKKGNTK